MKDEQAQPTTDRIDRGKKNGEKSQTTTDRIDHSKKKDEHAQTTTEFIDRSENKKKAVDEVANDAVPDLSGYEVLEKLAVGGMAAIFVARRHGASDLCVIKQLHGHHSEDEVVSNRFLREAQVAALLDHPNIARLTDAGRENEVFYLAMEFVAGKDLEAVMFKLMDRRRMLPPKLSVTATMQVLEGLEYAHSYRDSSGQHLEIVHRDLSPRNVMITFDGKIKIVDFGLARTNLGDFRTKPGMVLGTLRYMSPEQAVAEPVDHRSDIYSWGTVLYEMLSGQPFVKGENPREILHAVVTELPPPLSALNPNLPKALDSVLEKAMRKDREERFESAEAFRVALEEAAGELGRTPADHMGQFVSQMFPEDRARAFAMIESAAEGEYTSDPTRVVGLDELTQTAPTIFAQKIPAFTDDEETIDDEAINPKMYQATRAAPLRRPRPPPPRPRKSNHMLLLLGGLLVAVLILLVAIEMRDRKQDGQTGRLVESKKAFVEPLPKVVVKRKSGRSESDSISISSKASTQEVASQNAALQMTPSTKKAKKREKRKKNRKASAGVSGPTKSISEDQKPTKPQTPVKGPEKDDVDREVESILRETDALKAGKRLAALARTHIKGVAGDRVLECIADKIDMFHDREGVEYCMSKFVKEKKKRDRIRREWFD